MLPRLFTKSRVAIPSRNLNTLTMTVTTVSADSLSSRGGITQVQPFSTTTRDEASQFQTPKGSSGNSDAGPSYILTLRTDKSHQISMTKLRNIYFPPKLNKLNAHITLFHALPGEKLDAEIIPAIEEMVARTSPYRIRASGPSRLKAGISISVEDDIDYANRGPQGRNMTRIIHAELRKQWKDWLSDQDARPVRVHYTVMNKVNDDKVIEKAMSELQQTFKDGTVVSNGPFDHGDNPATGSEKGTVDDGAKGDNLTFEGRVEGLTLWRYARSGRWLEPQQFDFKRS